MGPDLREKLDETDWHLLNALQQNARLSYVELGRIVSLSRPAVAERMRRLEMLGIISGYRAHIDIQRLGQRVLAYIRIGAQVNTAAVLAEIALMPQVLECHHSSGVDAFVLKVAVQSLAQLQTLLDRLLMHGPASTMLVLSTLHHKRIVTEGLESSFGFEAGAGI
jgi:Lrp/AsnC family transcriptional regulator, leucine-responsive regulatory protein